MSDPIYKIIEVVGTSDVNVHEAVRNAIHRAAKTVHNLQWFEVKEIRGAIHNGEPRFQVAVRIGFRLDE
ncbi:Dodecin [Methylacidimicrobium sp. AP8]|uniref:dodecin n=1 Tax=Methylacidimicrobium sp. AP8 TaxID=2730359 RepID=UPI0018C04FC4|nr:dodecin [Methylacidimicrobium sp. AP8]CAB4244044.1 Dodecin [Methylacidimicrobium sp. AP8]